MSENKELLEATVKGLQDKIGSLNLELKQKQQDLEDVNKPELTAIQLGQCTSSLSVRHAKYSSTFLLVSLIFF